MMRADSFIGKLPGFKGQAELRQRKGQPELRQPKPQPLLASRPACSAG
jgi:hypothetical protein